MIDKVTNNNNLLCNYVTLSYLFASLTFFQLLVSSPKALPLKIQYGPEDPNSAKVWLERWTLLQVKEEKPRVSLRKSSVSNGLEKPTRKSAEKKKEIADSVQKESPDYEVSPPAQDELKTEERNDKAEEEIQEPDVQISSENGNDTKASDRRASLLFLQRLRIIIKKKGLHIAGERSQATWLQLQSAKAKASKRRTRPLESSNKPLNPFCSMFISDKSAKAEWKR
ncbi:hypothetical protein HID58_007894 [Brassica napus]|uniref:DUF4005 domain-containing protein n=1 Tax=Brassica napus TaxID=3708 RepID=A0ABQ7XI96_BRANA|nr:hypothetical protein HID58_007894 [Brassica napus]